MSRHTAFPPAVPPVTGWKTLGRCLRLLGKWRLTPAAGCLLAVQALAIAALAADRPGVPSIAADDSRRESGCSGVTEIKPPPADWKVDSFYKKALSAGGYPIVASGRVSDYALTEAAHLVNMMLARRPDVREAMIRSGSRMCILAHDEFTTGLPEFAHFSPKDYWDARARGTGGSLTDPYCSCGEENLLGYPGDPYAAECILIHEFAHNIHLRGLVNLDPTFDRRLKETYEAAMREGLWKGTYASVNHHEYFAEGVQSWFDNNRENDHDHNHVNTRRELVEYDRGLAAICREVFGDTELVYTKPATRLDGHLAGYDPSQAPRFAWPERLDAVRAGILADAKSRSRETAPGQQRKGQRAAAEAPSNAARPNVLFFAVDDLNDWIGCLGGHPQAKTPNLDRLAASGVLFTNAYCPGASCNPSRSAILSGIPPHQSGLYDNMQKMRQVMPDAELIPKYFSRHGYYSAGSGKILHYFIDAPSWDEYFPAKETEDPFPRTFYPQKRPVSLPYEPWMYVECDWAALDVTLDEYGGDYLVADFVGKQLQRQHDKPFFLACGIYRPHLPWFVPKEYYDLFPLDEVELPPGVKENDLDDVPEEGRRLAADRYLPHIRKYGKWREGVQAYLASIAFADDMVGRVLDALDNSPYRDNTIVVLWGDHGWHLGEKEHWRKFTGWRVCDRVPLMIRVPEAAPGLKNGTTPGSVCSRAVNLVDLFKTLNELCGLPSKDGIGGNSLLPLLAAPRADWPHASVTFFGEPERYAVSTERWRYIHYRDGGEELYDINADPYEWTNLAGKPEHQAQLARMRSLAPQQRAPMVETEPEFSEAQPERELDWHDLKQGVPHEGYPPSERSSQRSFVLFENRRDEPVKVYWIDPDGQRHAQGQPVPPGGERRIHTFNGHTFLIADAGQRPLGYVVADDRPARVTICRDTGTESSEATTRQPRGTTPLSDAAENRQGSEPQANRLKPDRPNILVLMGDDWSWPHAGAYGDRVVKTPTFDGIAREGVLFENAFVSSPSCTPSRLAVASGQWHWRLDEGANLGGSLREGVAVYAEMLQAEGYKIGFSRKGATPSEYKYTHRDPFGPRFPSFEQFLAERAPGQPFCFWYGAGEPHRPYVYQTGVENGLDPAEVEVPACLPDNETVRTDLCDYCWNVQQFDRDAGRMLAELEKLGELDDTLVVMTADNGMPFPRCKATLYDTGTHVPLAIRWGGKVGGSRTIRDFVSLTDLGPTFLEAAGLKPAAEMTGRSLMPILGSKECGQIDPARDHVLTGMETHVFPNPSRAIRTADYLYIRNFDPADWPTGRGTGPPPTYDFTRALWPSEAEAFSYNVDPSPTKQFMLEHPTHPVVERCWAPAFGKRSADELYDLRKDPGQLNNVAGDPHYSQIRKKLREQLESELRASEDPRFAMATKSRRTRVIAGWQVHVSEELFEKDAAAVARALELLEAQLDEIARVVPRAAVVELQKVPLWISPEYPGVKARAEYHPDAGWLRDHGRDPAMAKSVEFTNVRIFEAETRRMPNFALHELAHAYHHLVLGNNHPEIKAAYEEAKASGKYDRVEQRFGDGRTADVRAYAMNNPQEYFAENTEAFFSRNDFYPFTGDQLKQHDPEMFALLAKLWGVEAKQEEPVCESAPALKQAPAGSTP